MAAKETPTRELLLRVLKKALVAVDVSGITGIEQTKDFAFNDGVVVAYNDRVSISVPCPESKGLSLTCKAARLYGALQKVEEDELTLTTDENGDLTVKTDTTDMMVKSEPLEGDMSELLEGLALEKLKKKDWITLPGDFDQAVNMCLFSASKDVANVAYNCLHVSTDQVVSTDSWRISQYKFSTPAAEMDFLVPVRTAKELIGRELAEVQVGETRAWAHFRAADGVVFSVRILEIDFPDVEEFFQVAGKTISLPDGIGKGLFASLDFAEGVHQEDRVVTLQFEKGAVICVGKDDGGTIKRKVLAPGMLPPDNFKELVINPVFFLEICKNTTTMKVNKEGSRVLFKSGEFSHVMNLPE